MNFEDALKKMRESTTDYELCIRWADAKRAMWIQIFNEHVAPQITKKFGIEDWKLELMENEE